MAKLANLARMTTATTGTGTITLGAAKAGFLSFASAGIQNGDIVSYGITDGANSEVGTGVYTSSGTTLTRSVVKSTNSDNAISLSGSAEVFITALSEDVTRGATPNLLTNGGFDIWQRGTSISIAASTTATLSVANADLWYMETGANQACTIARQTGSSANARYGARIQRNSGQTGTGVLRFQTCLDTPDVVPLRGQTLTLSFRARKGTNYSATSDALAVKLYTGTGATAGRRSGALTGEATPISSSVTLTSSFQTFTVTSSALGASITQLALAFEFTPTGTASADDWYELELVKLEVGSSATPWVMRDRDGLLAVCMHTFCKTFSPDVAPANSTGSDFHNSISVGATAIDWEYIFPRPMRATPTLTYYSSTNGAEIDGRLQYFTGGTGWQNAASQGPANGTSINAVLTTIRINSAGGGSHFSTGLGYTVSGSITASADMGAGN